MKKLILCLSGLLVVLLAVAGYLYFHLPQTPEAPAAVSPTGSSMNVVMGEPEETPSESREETQAPTVTLEQSQDSPIVNGVPMLCWVFHFENYVTPEDFAAAAGLTLESTDPVKMSGPDDQVVFGPEGLTVTVFGETSTVPAETVTANGQVYVPFQALVDALNYSVFRDEEKGMTYYTPGARRFPIPQDVDVPVIMYHAVSDDIWGVDELFVSPEDMEEQLAYLVDNGYDPIWFEDLAHLSDYEKPVILTFDDGYDDNYTELFPLLEKYQVKATIFIITDSVGNQHKMNAKQIQELSESGLVSIQSHSHTHSDMDTLDAEATAYEMSQSKLSLVRLTGKEPLVLCYPTGKYNSYTLELAPEYYMFGLKMVGGQYNTSDDPYLVNRYYMSRYYDIDTFAGYLRSAGE